MVLGAQAFGLGFRVQGLGFRVQCWGSNSPDFATQARPFVPIGLHGFLSKALTPQKPVVTYGVWDGSCR